MPNLRCHFRLWPRPRLNAVLPTSPPSQCRPHGTASSRHQLPWGPLATQMPATESEFGGLIRVTELRKAVPLHPKFMIKDTTQGMHRARGRAPRLPDAPSTHVCSPARSTEHPRLGGVYGGFITWRLQTPAHQQSAQCRGEGGSSRLSQGLGLWDPSPHPEAHQGPRHDLISTQKPPSLDSVGFRRSVSRTGQSPNTAL